MADIRRGALIRVSHVLSSVGISHLEPVAIYANKMLANEAAKEQFGDKARTGDGSVKISRLSIKIKSKSSRHAMIKSFVQKAMM